MISLKIGLHTFACLGIMWSCACRWKHMNKDTNKLLGAAFTALGVAAMLLCVAPFLWSHVDWWGRITINWTQLFFMYAALGVQVITAESWRKGVPRIWSIGGGNGNK